MLAILALLIGGAAVLSHTAPFPFLFEAFRPGGSVWQVPPQPGSPPTVYLTFDDGPNATWTPALLDALEETGAKATFFLIDEHITDETEPILRRMAAEGHAIGLHSGTRRRMMDPPAELVSRLQTQALRIERVTGQAPCRLFRPHAGWRSATMYRGLQDAGYRLAGWSWGMWDFDWWRRPRSARVAERLSRKASGGDVIVIHDGHHENPRADRRHAAETVRQLVPALRARGFAFGRLCAPGS
ncbi:MAG TPA: polysaccharide deacetylase family protein [Vicinamibacterales bacterium]|nr:polysaccharide deacetylase family protein [Vicinamibacterales bacterium]